MDDLFGMLGGSLRSSITDSTMMWIVHYAMDKAHGKVKSNRGILQRLNEISKFYELAVIQLEGCLRFVQEEADHGVILESCHERVLTDLTEIRDRLIGRLKESELAILGKDQELLERFENELKLKQALELKERELVSLNDNFKIQSTNSEDVVELKGVSGTEDSDGEFGELMQQVLNIKQQLDPDSSLINKGVDNKKIEQMGFDINILKETMDHAFGKMQDAIFLSELRPQENKWRWTIEKETIGILIRGFLMDFKDNFEVETRKQEKQHSTGLTEHMSHLIKEATSLRNELESLIDLNEAQPNHSNAECTLLPKKGDSIDSLSSQLHEDEPEKDGSLVAKMIRSHESIIRRKSEESNWLRREILGEKGCSSSTREKGSVSLKGRIEDLIVRLDNLIDCNNKLVNFGGYGTDHREEASPMQECDANYTQNAGVNNLEDVWEKMNTPSVSQAINEELNNEIRMLKQEKEDGTLLIMIMEETHAIIFRDLMSKFYTELHAHTIESLITECAYEEFYAEMINELKGDVASNQAESQTREDIFYIVCSETIKDFCSALDFASVNFKDEYALREEVSTILFQEMYKEWNAGLERYSNETLVREDISRIVLDEFIGDVVNTANYILTELEEAKVAENCIYGSLNIKSVEIAEYAVKEQVYMVFFRQVIDEWKMEIDDSLIKDEMHQFILIEAMKEASLCLMKTEAQKQDKSADIMEASLEENLIQNLDMQVKCCEEEKDVLPSSELNELDGRLDLVAMQQELNEHDIFQESINDDEITLTSVRSKPEKANKRLAMSKMVFSQLGSGLAIGVDDQVTPADTVHEGKSCFCQQNYNAGFYIDQSDSLFKAILEFPQFFVNFKILAHQKLGNSLLRLEGMKHQLDSLVEVVASKQKREFLYREAFIRRCQNLQKAETEVDLLGDQVDVLLGLLEKIHMTLHQYSPMLQQHSEVSEILKLIQKELTGEVHGLSKK